MKRYFVLLLLLTIVISAGLNPPVIKLNKSVYKIGEKVIITVINPNNEPMVFPNPNPYKIISVDTGETVYTPISPQVLYKLEGRKSFIRVWNQTDNSGNQVPPGKYVVVVQWSEGEVKSDTFEIKGEEENTIRAYIMWTALIGLMILIILVFVYVSKVK